jgi:hypothetical protein
MNKTGNISKKQTKMTSLEDVLSSVPASSHFIETHKNILTRNLGGWLSKLDNESLHFILCLFKPMQENQPEGMSLPVCDVISLCLLIREWESGESFNAEDAWESAAPLIPRLRRAVLVENLRRKGLLNISHMSIMDDDFKVELCHSEATDRMLANLNGLNLFSDCVENSHQKEFENLTDFDEDMEDWR